MMEQSDSAATYYLRILRPAVSGLSAKKKRNKKTNMMALFNKKWTKVGVPTHFSDKRGCAQIQTSAPARAHTKPLQILY